MHWIWEQPDWPQFRWDAEQLLPALRSAHAQRLALQQLLNQLDSNLREEASAALLYRESLSTADIEGEQLDPAEVRSSVARRLQLPLERNNHGRVPRWTTWCKRCSQPRPISRHH